MDKRTGRKRLLKLVLMSVIMCYTISLTGNNLRLNGVVKVTDVTSGVATLEVDLSWDNSWRDEFNWDGVWVFLKYKPALGNWSSVLLQDAGHSATNGYEVMSGKSGSSVTGVFVYPGTAGVVRRASTKLTLKWACGSGYTKSSFDNNDVFLLAQGIEMVYIPYGAYYLGDAYSRDCFSDAAGHPLIIDSEDSRTLYQRSQDSSVSVAVSNLPASYPKGYQGYYIMKYELSQEQYVRFLNTLTKAEQESLLGAFFLSGLSAGRYVFGDTLQASFRNGIVLRSRPSGRAYIFDHDLNGNGVYGENGDGQCIACNYMSVNDLLAYASWSGLRPMSELEYERACRAAFPQESQKGEYAWNTSGHISSVTSLLASGKESEVPAVASANANSGNGLGLHLGPVRCGAFAGENSTQIESGGSYWGVMEMSGNVGELVANVANTGLSRTVNGNGAFNLTSWSATPSHYGVRGGSFSGEDSLLRISDRTQMPGYVSSLTKRDSTVGFRLVQTLNTSGITITPGMISLEGPLCPGVTSTVSETAPAGISGISGDFPLSYLWSYSTDDGSTWTVLAGETDNILRYDAFEDGRIYLFRRKAICAVDEVSVQTTGVAVTTSTAIISVSRMETIPCRITFTVTAKGESLAYQWQQDGNRIPDATHTDYVANFDGWYSCQVSGTCGTIVSHPEKVELSLPEDRVLTDPRDGKKYKTRILADGREWMVEDLRFGICDASAFTSYYRTSVQNQIAEGYWGVCFASAQPGAGYRYNWQAVMNHPDAVYNTNGNPSGNVNGNSPVQWQGICPPGWHVPTGGSTGEFQQLYTALGSTASRIYPGCSDFCGILGGDAGGNVDNTGRAVWYWSSTYMSAAYANDFYFDSGSVRSQNYDGKFYGLGLRCVKNY